VNRTPDPSPASPSPARSAPALPPGDLRSLLPVILERQSELAARRRRRTLLAGLGLSVLAHLLIVAWLALNLRPGWGPDQSTVGVSVSAATERDTTLSDAADAPASDPSASDLAQLEPSATDLEAVAPVGAALAAASSSAPSLGGSGSASNTGGGAGGSGTSFFGIRSTGSRFAYIVDRSGSMQSDRRMESACAEVVRSIEALPEHALFHVALFSSNHITPPHQRQWLPARSRAIRLLRSWIVEVEPSGSTFPRSALESVFALPQRPDVVFFLTDGEIPEDTSELIAELNGRGRRVVVNTIAFGEPASQEQLRRIARESGGQYRFVDAGGMP
jgi:hypothetical protein